jgi:homospermidine synthase
MIASQGKETKMSEHRRHVRFDGRLLMVGFGSIGQGVLPLILRHVDITPGQISIVSAHASDGAVAAHYNIPFEVNPLTRENYKEILKGRLGEGDFLLNLSVDVSSVALIEHCWEVGALYLDTCIEPWAGGYFDASLPPTLRSNYALREQALALRNGESRPTAVLTHGANPGLVSHFVKQALLNIASDLGRPLPPPTSRRGWAGLAMQLGIKCIHIAERDTQVARPPKKPGEFVNTWSVDGFVSEGSQPAELGWGSHERHWPGDGFRHEYGCGSAIYLKRPGLATRVRTWTPLEGPFHGFLITHGESISISDYFTLAENDHVLYRPTVHYAYHPCDDAVLSIHELAGKNLKRQAEDRILMDEIEAGIDELGVLLTGHEKGAYWYGSQLSIGEARRLVPHNNATSLQVTAAVLAGLVWAIENPERGVVEPDEMDFDRALEIMTPYLGPVVGQYSDWTPLADRGVLFEEDLDLDDPWQFKNVRVT